MEYTLTHQNCRKPSRGPTWSRRQTLVNTNGPRRQTHVRAKGQRCAHRTLGAQRSQPRAHSGLTVRSSRGVSTPPRNAYRGRQCCAGRNREDPRNRALAAARNGPKSTPAARKPGAVGLSRASQAPSWRGPHLGKPRERDPARNAASSWRQNLFLKVGPGAHSSKANKAARVAERKVCLFSKVGDQGPGQEDSCSKARSFLSMLTGGGQELL